MSISNKMIITCRNIFYLCLVLSVLFQPLRAEEPGDAVPGDDPALEAVEALTGEDTSTESTEITSPETIPPEVIETEAAPEIVPDESADIITEEIVGDTEIQITAPVEDQPIAKDVILVLDNSGSMKKNDPQFLASRAVNEFISSLDDESRVGIIIFDQSVRVAKPLTPVSDATRDEILKSLDQINYKGQFTDSPAAIERAIYDLKNNGRPDAKKLIVFMTDGIVDTGNADKDLEKAKWLKQDLAADAADAEISIFGIAFTEEADFQLIQSLSQQTEGEYYRALKPEDLDAVFTQVHGIINRVPEPEPVVIPEPVAPAEPKEVAPPPPPPQPVIIEVPVQSTKLDEEEELRSMMIMVALAVLIVAVIIMVLMLIRGSRKKDKEDEYAQEAFLNDINNYTSQATYKLGSKPTMLGRVAGTDTDHLNYIVIPQTTIGRRHALIEYKDFAYWIIDQGSINGTFVNDQMISSETRLKHGDRVRLHKYEFEFVMPEMVDAGMTVISNTVMASNPAMHGEEPTIARSGNTNTDDADMPEPDFDITGSSDDLNPDEEDTIVRGTPPEDEEESSDETIMLGEESEPVLPDEEDATLRPDMDDDDEDLTVDDFMDSHKKK